MLEQMKNVKRMAKLFNVMQTRFAKIYVFDILVL